MDDRTETPIVELERPAEGAPHKFVDSGTGRTRHTDVHARGRMSTEWRVNP